MTTRMGFNFCCSQKKRHVSKFLICLVPTDNIFSDLFPHLQYLEVSLGFRKMAVVSTVLSNKLTMGTVAIKVCVSLSDGDLMIGPCRSQRLGRQQELAI